MTVEELYVNGFDSNEVDWLEIGSSPYLHNTDVDYIIIDYTIPSAFESRFSFPASGGSGTINSVKIRFRAEQAWSDYPGAITVDVWTGTVWLSIGTVEPGTSMAWFELDASGILNSWAKINDAKVRFMGVCNPDDWTAYVKIDRCTRKVDYTAVPVYKLPQNLAVIRCVPRRRVAYVRKQRQTTIIQDIFKRIVGFPRLFIQDLSVLRDVFSFVYTPFVVPVYKFVQNLSVLSDVLVRRTHFPRVKVQDLSTIGDRFTRRVSYHRSQIQTVLVEAFFRRIHGMPRTLRQNLSVISAKFIRRTSYFRVLPQRIIIEDVFKRVAGFPRKLVEDLSVVSVPFIRIVSYMRKLPQVIIVEDLLKRFLGFPRKFVQNLSVLTDAFIRKVAYSRRFVNSTVIMDVFKRIYGTVRRFIEDLRVPYFNPGGHHSKGGHGESGKSDGKIEPIDTAFRFKTKSEDYIYIGDPADPEFHPKLKINRWIEECSLKLLFDDSKIKEKSCSLDEVENKVKWKTEDFDFHFYPVEARTFVMKHPQTGEDLTFLQNELGGLEFEIILKKKPTSNKVVLAIEAKKLIFYYQPPIHPDHPTWTDENGDGIADNFCPENVVGSYAIYHTTRTNMHRSQEDAEKYKAGKAFHIYRPFAKDSAEKTTWCNLHVDEAKGVLTITIPQEFLDKAVYPLSIDPTFGYTTKGASTTQNNNNAYKTLYDLGENGIATTLTLYVKRSGTDSSEDVGVYNGTSLLVHLNQTVPDGYDNWMDFDITDTSLNSGTYGLGLKCTSGSYVTIVYYDTGTASQTQYDSGLLGGSLLPDPFGIDGYVSRKYSIYCTYTLVPKLVRALFRRRVTYMRRQLQVPIIRDVFSFIRVPFIKAYKFVQEVVIQALFVRRISYIRKIVTLTLIEDILKRLVGFPRRLVQNLWVISVLFVRRSAYLRRLIQTMLIREVLTRVVGFPRKLIEDLSVLKDILIRKIAFRRRLRENLSVIQDVFSFIRVPLLKIYRFVQNLSVLSDVFTRRASYIRKIVNVTLIQDLFRRVQGFPRLLRQDLSTIGVRFIRTIAYLRKLVQTTLIRDVFRRIVGFPRKLVQDLSVIATIFSRRVSLIRLLKQTIVLQEVFKRVATYVRTLREIVVVRDVFKRMLAFTRRFVQKLIISEIFKRIVGFPRKLVEDLSVISTVFIRRVAFVRRLIQTAVIREVFRRILVLARRLRQDLSPIQALLTRRIAYLRRLVQLTYVQDVFSYVLVPFIKVYRLIQTIVISASFRRRVSYIRKVLQDLSILRDLFSSVYRRFIPVYRLVQNLSVIGAVLRRRVYIEDIIAQLGTMSTMVADALEELENKVKKVRAKFKLR